MSRKRNAPTSTWCPHRNLGFLSNKEAIALFEQQCSKRARKFLAYVKKHRHRLVNYELLQTEHHISIGSGAVESAIK